MRRYLLGLLTASSQLGNALIGGRPTETLSARAARSQHLTGWWLLGLLLEAVHRGHLRWASQRERAGE